VRLHVSVAIVWMALLTPVTSSDTALGQTISPLVAEYLEKADGSFAIRNDTTLPFTLVLEARSFSVDENGDSVFRPLDSEISLQLSAKSFRVLPHRSYTVFYKASAPHVPAWFSLYASITGLRPVRPGIQLVLKLPHTVYLVGRTPVTYDAVVVSDARASRESKTVILSLENHSAQYTRVQ